MNHISKPVIATKENGEEIRFHVLVHDMTHPGPNQIKDDMLHFINPDTLITDNLPSGIYIAIPFREAYEINKSGTRELIAYLETYTPESQAYWFQIKGDELRSLTKNRDITGLLDYMSKSTFIIPYLKIADSDQNSFSYIFVKSN